MALPLGPRWPTGDSVYFRSFALRVPAGHVLAVGSMVTKVTSVRQFRLNSSLYVSGLTGRAGAPRSFFLSVWDDAGECVEAANNNKTTNYICFFPP